MVHCLYCNLDTIDHFNVYIFHIQRVSDINECHGNHSCDQLCHNTPGSYRCLCKPGYKFGSNDLSRKCIGKYLVSYTVFCFLPQYKMRLQQHIHLYSLVKTCAAKLSNSWRQLDLKIPCLHPWLQHWSRYTCRFTCTANGLAKLHCLRFKNVDSLQMSTSVQIKPQDVNISATTQLEVSNAAVEMASNLISTESLVQVNFGDQYHGCKLLVVLQSLYFLHTATVFFSQI